MEKPKKYIASCSFGKDSIATILLALKHNEPLDAVVFAEVMFDHSKGISGEVPEHIDWIYNTAIPKLEDMGVKVDVVKAEKDYIWYFTHPIPKGKYSGMLRGFPLGGRCIINRDCKLHPIKKYYKQIGNDFDIIQYVGIAYDEPIRLARLKPNQISLLAKYGYTEKMAFAMCENAGLLSPIYSNRTRGGCFFCPSARLKEYIYLRKHHPQLWHKLRELSQTPNLCSYGFKYGKTLQEVEQQMDRLEQIEKRQLKLNFTWN